MKRLAEIFQIYGEARKQFFRKARGQMAEDNLRTLTGACLATVGILTFFLVLTPFLIQGWTPSFYHLGFWPASVAVSGLVLFLRGKNLSSQGVTALCVLFSVLVFTFVILIDTAAAQHAPASFLPVMCIALPSIFTLPVWLAYGLPLAAAAVFAALAAALKDPEVAQYDIFNTLVGLLCSAVMSHLVLSLRLRDYETRMKYKLESTYDALTGLYNKQSSTEASRQYFKRHNPETVCAMLVLDLDDFKQVNDTRGHYVGDQVLRCMGEALSFSFRSSDITGRFGGDEFFILIKGTASQTLAERKCQMIQDTFRRLTQEEAGFPVGCSIGALLVHKENVRFEELFRQADALLYQAKSAGKGQYLCQKYPLEELLTP